MLTTVAAVRRTLRVIRTRARAARHLGVPWTVVVRAALGDARYFSAVPVPEVVDPIDTLDAMHRGGRGVRL